MCQILCAGKRQERQASAIPRTPPLRQAQGRLRQAQGRLRQAQGERLTINHPPSTISYTVHPRPAEVGHPRRRGIRSGTFRVLLPFVVSLSNHERASTNCALSPLRQAQGRLRQVPLILRQAQDERGESGLKRVFSPTIHHHPSSSVLIFPLRL